MKNEFNFEEAKKSYNNMMYDFALEHLTIGTKFSEDTDGWNIRDLVSECQYQLDLCYEEGNSNSEGRYIQDYIDMYGSDLKEAEDAHNDWLDKTRRLRSFIRKYKKYAEYIKCTQGHCSKFD